MDYKKIFILPILFFGSTLLYIGCCKCVEHTRKFFKVNSLTVQARGSGNNVIDSGTITTVDTVYLRYNLMGECIVKHGPDLSFLVNTAQALKCDCINCGSEGLKNKIANITITSDSVYDNIPAHQSLNSLFQLYDGFGTAALPFDSIVPTLNKPYGYYYGFDILTTRKPNNNKGHVFKLTIQFADGQTLFIDTRRIFWI